MKGLLSLGFLLLCASMGGGEVPQGAVSHSSSDPEKCKSCSKALQAALDYIEKVPKPGRKGVKYEISRLYDPFFAGFVYLVSGRHLKELEEAVETLSNGKFYAQDGFNRNWAIAMSGLFLSEIYKRYPTEKVKSALEEILKLADENVGQTGGWSHNKGFSYPKGLGRDLGIVTSIMFGAMLNMKKSGIPVPEKLFATVQANLEGLSDGMGVIYGTGNGVMDATMGRASWMYLGLHALQFRSCKYFASVPRGLDSRFKNTDDGHAYPPLHYAGVALASHLAGPQVYNKFALHWMDRLIPLQKEDGSVSLPHKENMPTQKNNEFVSSTAAFALILLLQKPGALERDVYGAKKSASGAIFSKPGDALPWLGVRLTDGVLGAKVKEVVKGSPAEQAGVEAGSYLIEIKGARPGDVNGLRQAASTLSPGQKVDVLLLCPAERKTLQITVGKPGERVPADDEL